MVGFFPDFYPDELLYSACARYADRINYLNKETVHKRLFGRRATTIPVLIPTSLNYFVNQLPEGHRYTVNQIIDQHTLLPFYGSFISGEKLAQIRAQMTDDNRDTVLRYLGSNSLVAAPTFLRFCPACIEDDRKTHGVCYWHRSHQTPGVEVCVTHHTLLAVSKVPIRKISSNTSYISTEAASLTTSIEELDPSNRIHLEMEKLAKNILWLYKEPLHTITSELARIRYLNLLNEKNLVSMAGQVHLTELGRAVQTYYSREFLVRLGCEISNPRDNWLRVMLTNRKKHLSPIHHILVIQFLILSVEEFFNITGDTPSYGLHIKWFGDGPWPCLNPECSNYNALCIDECTIKIDTHHQRLQGIFSCKVCSFTYLRKSPDQAGEMKYKLGQIVRDMNLGTESAPKLEGPTNNMPVNEPMSATPGGNNLDIARVQKYRNRLLGIIDSTPGITRHGLERRARYGYTYLMNNDRGWFEANVPESKRNINVNWKALDESIATKLPKVACQLQKAEGKPASIRRDKLLTEAGLAKSRLKKLDHLPKSKALAQKLAETTVEFGLRRLAWVVKKYHNASVSPSRTDLIREAGISHVREEPSVVKAIEEALASLRNSRDATTEDE